MIEQLKEKWSPEIIAGRMKAEIPDVNICKETIYQFIYSDEGRQQNLYKYLDRSRPRRGMKKGKKPRSIPDRVSIHNRPKEIELREELGHFEGDLIINQGSMSANVAVVIERKTRMVRLIKNDNKQSSTVMQGIFNEVAQLPPEARKSITFDNGTEFAKHGVMGTMDMKTYFCDPYSPWQKGQVERANRSIRRHIPKSIPFKDLSLEELALVEEKLNNLPRKCLGFKTPMEMFNQEIAKSKTNIVAFRA